MRIVRLAETPSTQEVARALPVGTVVVADLQTRGRGRLDRGWDAPRGTALLATFVLPSRPLALFRAGVAAAHACGIEVRLKWPNDLLLSGRKVAGLLAEQRNDRVLVGTGINLSWAPPGGARLGQARDDLLQRLIDAVEDWWERSPEQVLQAWRSRADTLGRRVRVELPGRVLEGMAERIDDDGALVVDGQRVVVGDVVHLRSAPHPGQTPPEATPAGVGNRRRRVEDPPLLRGEGRYAGDIRLPGMVHLAMVRSPLGHARVTAVETAAARALEGVLAVWTAADLPEGARVVPEDRVPPGLDRFFRPVIAEGQVRYQGEILAVVIAETDAVAADAADLVELFLDPLDAVGSVEAAIADGAPSVHPSVPGNVAFTAGAAFGDPAGAFAGAPVIVHRHLRLARVQGAAMEPRVVTVEPRPRGVRVWTSTQSVFSVRGRLAQALGVEPDDIEVLAENVGGGFGPKGRTYPEELLTALAARRCKRPARWVATRSEDSATTVHGHGTVFDLELAAERDGTLRGLRGEFWHDTGAYASIGAGIAANVATHLLCGYRLPAMGVRHHSVFTNATPTGTVRGGGRPEGNFAIERMMDALADELEQDRVEIRRRNLLPPHALPYAPGLRAGPAPVVYDSGDSPGLLARAVEVAGRAAPAPPGRVRGLGFSFGVESTGFGSGEPARVRLLPDGTVELYVGSTPQGQGHETFAAQMLVEQLSWPLDQVHVIAGDTRGVASGGVTAGSRSAVHVGSATALAAAAMREEVLRRAGDRLEVAREDLILEQGVIAVRGVPERAIRVTDLLDGEPLELTRAWETDTGTSWAASCHAAEVEVDPETGHVEVVRYLVVHDSGREINPRLVEGQLQGGIAHGIGYALFEEATYDAAGQFQSASFLDYTLASAAEIAFVPTLISQESRTDFNPASVKGVGEAGTIPAPAAVLSAIEAALRPLAPRLRLDELPVSPLRLQKALTGN